MGPVQKPSQKPVSEHKKFEESDSSAFSRNVMHSGINKQHSTKSVDLPRHKLPQRFEWVLQNIRQVKTEEVLNNDDDELEQTTDEAISQLEAVDHEELQNLNEKIAILAEELANQEAFNDNLDRIIEEQERDLSLLEGIKFHALQISLDIKKEEDDSFLAGLEAGYEQVDRKVEEIEAMLMQIPFMREYIVTKRQYEETKSTLDSLSKRIAAEQVEVEDGKTGWYKRRCLDDKLTEGGDGGEELEEPADESTANAVATADVISSRAADDNPKDSSPGSTRLQNDSTQMHNPDDVGRQSDDEVGASSVTSLDYQTMGEKELRELNENPDLLSGFERDFDDDGDGGGDSDSLFASVSSILMKQRQRRPDAAGAVATKDQGTDAAASKAAAEDGGSDSSVFKRPATPLEVSRRPTGGRLRFDQPLSCRRIVSREESRGSNQDRISPTMPIAKGPPNTSEVNVTAASASQTEEPIHHESAVYNSRPDSAELQEASGPKNVPSRIGQVSPSTLSAGRVPDPPATNQPSPSAIGWNSTFLSLSRTRALNQSEPAATGSKNRSPSTEVRHSSSASSPRTPDYRKRLARLSPDIGSTPTTPDQRTHHKSVEPTFDWKSKLNASPFLRDRDQPKVVEMPQSPMFTTPQRIATNPETPLSAYLPCDESPLFSSSLSVPPPLSKEAASRVAIAPDSSYGWMQEGPIESGSTYDFVFADRDEDEDDAEDDVSAAYFQS